MAEPLNCAAVKAQDVIERYVAETLPESEAEAFEAHYLACADCWADLQAALELRRELATGVSTSPAAAPASPGRAPSGRPAMWLAIAAAAVLAITAGVWRALPTSPDNEPVLRGATNSLSVTAIWESNGSLAVTWQPAPAAALYRVRLSGGGAPSLTRSSQSPLVRFSASEAAAFGDAAVVVEAEDGAGEVVARSRLTSVPPHP